MGLGVLLFLLLCLQEAFLTNGDLQLQPEMDAPFLPQIPPSGSPLPLLNPLPSSSSPVSPFFNISTGPKLSGQCSLNFTSIDSLITTTATDCLATFAPYLANVICCPQLDATLTILIGLSSLQSGQLSLHPIHANHCLSDIQLLLSSRGSQSNLKSICDLHLDNFTGGSCPVTDVNAFESLVDSSRVLAACQKIDPVNECCSRICQNGIEDAARRIAGLKGGNGYGLTGRFESCKRIVVRWLASRLHPGPAKMMLRQISNCNVNGVCPLVFPDTRKVAQECAQKIKNVTQCCDEMDGYVAHLHNQSFITNLQALDCAQILAVKLQNRNVTKNIYSLCDVSLKDFSLQVGSQESGCLLPSLPSDAMLDPISGVSFTCDLNDNIAAPWPSSIQASTSSCNKSVNFPALPAATQAVNGVGEMNGEISLLASMLFTVVQILLFQG